MLLFAFINGICTPLPVRFAQVRLMLVGQVAVPEVTLHWVATVQLHSPLALAVPQPLPRIVRRERHARPAL